jgi:RimJ/RimL family protein N-acetyltransferase
MLGREMTASDVVLRDGTTVDIRSIEPGDRTNLASFHEALSVETIRTRFLGNHPHLGDEELEHFVTVDHENREALIALDGDDIVGVGRYERLPDSRDAEVAFAVTDDRQRGGLAPILLRLLATRARDMGIEHFVAETLESNRPMIHVFMHSGLPTTTSSSSGILTLSMSL